MAEGQRPTKDGISNDRFAFKRDAEEFVPQNREGQRVETTKSAKTFMNAKNEFEKKSRKRKEPSRITMCLTHAPERNAVPRALVSEANFSVVNELFVQWSEFTLRRDTHGMPIFPNTAAALRAAPARQRSQGFFGSQTARSASRAAPMPRGRSSSSSSRTGKTFTCSTFARAK